MGEDAPVLQLVIGLPFIGAAFFLGASRGWPSWFCLLPPFLLALIALSALLAEHGAGDLAGLNALLFLVAAGVALAAAVLGLAVRWARTFRSR